MANPVYSNTPIAPEIAVRIEAEMTRLLYRSQRFGLIVNGLLALALGIGLGDFYSWRIKGIWIGGVVAVSITRWILIASYYRCTPAATQLPRWRTAFIVGSALSAGLWGWAGVYFFNVGDTFSSLLVIMMIAGMNAAASRSMAPVPWCYRIYVALSMLPPGILFLIIGDGGWLLAISTFTFGLFLVSNSKLQHADLQNFHRLLFENEAYLVSLQDAKTKAEEANRIKGDFLATMSHEIRTPMNGVIGMLQVLKNTSLNSDQNSHVNIATNSAHTLLRLLNDILDFSKMESDKLEFENLPFSPTEAVREVVELLRSNAAEKQLSLNLSLPPGSDIYVLGDAVRLKQVLLNLIGNAIKFTEKGDVNITMEAHRNSENKVTIRFQIADTGIGMDPATQQKLFKVFSQGDSSTTRRFGGSGLGLAISQRLVTMMGGQITVSSQIGGGSTFQFEAPFQITYKPALGETPSTNPPQLSGNILVAEDDAVNQQVIKHMLKRIGLEHTLVTNGEEALAAAKTRGWDIILMDCQMPIMDGYAATRAIREHLKGRPLPIIALTANVLSTDRQACLDAGMDDFLSKPVRQGALYDCLSQWIRDPEHSDSPPISKG